MKLKLLLCLNIFFIMPLCAENSLNVSSVSRSISDRHFSEKTFQQKIKTYIYEVSAQSIKRTGLFDDESARVVSWALSQAQTINPRDSLKSIITTAQHITDALDKVTESNSSAIGDIMPVYSALAVRVSAALCYHARVVVVNVLHELHEHIAYWEYQDVHQWYYLGHKSPLKFFSKQKQAREIESHLRLLRGARSEHFKLLGQLVSWSRSFDQTLGAEKQIDWANRGITIAQIMCGRPGAWDEKSIEIHEFMYDAADVAPALLKHKKTIDNVIYCAKKPNHFTRHWMGYTSTVAAGVAAGVYLKQNPHKIPELFGKAKQAAKDAYNTHLNEPIQDIKRAVWGGTKEDELAQKIKEELKNLEGRFGNLEKVPRNEAEESYAEAAIKIRDLCFPNGQPDYDDNDNGEHGMCVWKSNEEIEDAAKVLDKEFFLKRVWSWYSDYSSKAGKAGFVGYGHTILDSFKLVPELFTTTMQIFAHHGGDMSQSARRIGDVIIKELLNIRRQNRINIAAIALLPIGLITYGVYKGFTKFGSLLLPSPYDDTPLKDALTNARDLLDDCAYLSDQECMEDVHVGRLFYYIMRIRRELKHLNPESKRALQKYLPGVEYANSLEGKRVYLEKMYKEYENWHTQRAV